MTMILAERIENRARAMLWHCTTDTRLRDAVSNGDVREREGPDYLEFGGAQI
jgi:hypothetical protein